MGRYSLKRGRGPSAFGAVGGVVGAIFGILWTVLAINLTVDAPFPAVRAIFPLFVMASVAGAAYNAHNAARPNRFSTLDVVPTDSEPDPLAVPRPHAAVDDDDAPADRYCSQCGAGLRRADRFCSRCGAAVSG